MKNDSVFVKVDFCNALYFKSKVKVACSYDNKKWFFYYDYNNYDFIDNEFELPIDIEKYTEIEKENFNELYKILKYKGNYIDCIKDTRIKYLLILVEENIKYIYELDDNVNNTTNVNAEIRVLQKKIKIKPLNNYKKLIVKMMKRGENNNELHF